MLPSFQQTQYKFASHIRNPDTPIEGIEPRRMKIYEDLFFKNIEGFASSAFPVFRSLFSDEQWLGLVREFMINHQAKTPYFLEISQEFLAFISAYQGDLELPCFAASLCHYEWVELALDVSEQEPDWTEINPNGDLLEEPVVVSPVAWPLAYDFPVHQISASFQPTEASEVATFLLVYRERDLAVRFMEINAMTYQLLQLLNEHSSLSGREVLTKLGEAIGFADQVALQQFGLQLLEKLQADGIVLGCKNSL